MVKPSENKRISKADMYLNCAENFAYRSTCLKRKYGAVIVKDDVVISTGYNGSPEDMKTVVILVSVPELRERCIREKVMVCVGLSMLRPMRF